MRLSEYYNVKKSYIKNLATKSESKKRDKHRTSTIADIIYLHFALLKTWRSSHSDRLDEIWRDQLYNKNKI